MKRDRYVLTFKNNDKEQRINEFLASKVNPTAYIKELVWDVMNNQVKNNSVINDNENITIENKEQQVKKKKVGSLKNPNK